MDEIQDVVTGVAAGVPFVAHPPAGDAATAPVVVAWHLLSPPCTPEAFAAAIPLTGLDAWRIHLGLPLTGARLPEGGYDEILRLSYADAVRNVQYASPRAAADEFPAAFAALREQLGFGADVPVGLVGGSAGSEVVQRVLAEGTGPQVAAAVLLSPVVQLDKLVDAVGRQFGVEYPWDDGSRALAAEHDFVARADELAASGAALRIVVGSADDEQSVVEPARRWHAALAGSDLVLVEGLAHDLAEEPGTEPAPQLPGAATVDALAVEWLREHLR